MKKQTAVEWLALQLPIGLRESFSKEIKHAIQLEREQIEDAVDQFYLIQATRKVKSNKTHNGGQDEK
jgi:hypothetical protein